MKFPIQKTHNTGAIIFSIVLLLIFCSSFICKPVLAQESAPEIPQNDFSDAPAFGIVRIIDGNTIVILFHDKETEVRLLGVDVRRTDGVDNKDQDRVGPSTLFLQNLLTGESVYLMRDTSVPVSDKDGRMLAYVYRAPDGLFVNLDIVRQGYARVSVEHAFTYSDLFRFYEGKARDSGKRSLPIKRILTEEHTIPAPQRIVITNKDLEESALEESVMPEEEFESWDEAETPHLNCSVSYIDDSFQIFNGNDYPWSNVKIEVTDGIRKGSYVYNLKKLESGEIVDIPAVDFAHADGKRFDARATKPKGMLIKGNTPRGKRYFETQW